VLHKNYKYIFSNTFFCVPFSILSKIIWLHKTALRCVKVVVRQQEVIYLWVSSYNLIWQNWFWWNWF